MPTVKDKNLLISPVKKLKQSRSPATKRLAESVKKINLSNTDLSSFDINELFDYEYIYMRNGQLSRVNLQLQFPLLRVIDLSANELSSLVFLEYTPLVKHLFLSCNNLESLEDLPVLMQLESLNLTSNSISSFSGLSSLPKLRVLNLGLNNISNFQYFPVLPQLDTINLEHNPIVDLKDFREIVYGLTLRVHVINHSEVTHEEREKGYTYRGSVALSARSGMAILKDEDVDVLERAEEFFKQYQIEKTKPSGIQLVTLAVSGEFEENTPVYFHPVFQVIRDNISLVLPAYLSTYKFVVNKSAESVQLKIEVATQNLVFDLDKIDDDRHEITLLLPVNTYSVKYVIDGSEEIEGTVTVTEDSNDTDGETPLYVDVKWYKSYDGISYVPADSENSAVFTPTYEDVGYSLKAEISASSEVSKANPFFSLSESKPNKIKYGLPQAKSVKVEGKFSEGSTLTLNAVFSGGDEGDSIIKWTGPNNRIITGTTYDLTLEDVDSIITVEYTPVRKDGTAGNTVKVETPVINAAVPKVWDININGKLVQDSSVSVDYQYYGGYEGESIVQWYKSNNTKNDLFVPIQGANKRNLDLTLELVNKKLKVVITPISNKSVRGSSSEKVSGLVYPGAPKFTDVQLNEVSLVEDGYIQVVSSYYGGIEGKSAIQWFRVDTAENKVIVANDTDKYSISPADIGYFIEVVKTPVRSDGVTGTAEVLRTSRAVEAGPPTCVSISTNGTFAQDETVTASAKYKGGYEGESIYEWFRSNADDEFELISTGKKLNLGIEDIGQTIKLRYTPVRSDGEIGEPSEVVSPAVKPAPPRMTDVKMTYTIAEEGITAFGSGSFHGGVEIVRNHKWIRVTENNEQIEIQGAEQDTYTFSVEDINCRIMYGVRSVRSDITTGWTLSLPTDPIEPKRPRVTSMHISGDAIQDGVLSCEVVGDNLSVEKCKYRWTRNDEPISGDGSSYYITEDDVGSVLTCHVIPIRNDVDIEGEEVSCDSTVVLPGLPRATKCEVEGESEEEKELTAITGYYGGKEGKSVLKWFRVKDNQESLQIKFSGKTTYQISLADVGSSIKFEYTPIRDDGVTGEPISRTTGPVKPAFPAYIDLVIEGNAVEDGKLVARGKYYGGHEGASMKRWKRQDGVNNPTVAVETNEYSLRAADVGFSIVFEITPIRSDGVKGKLVQAQTETVAAKPPTVTNVKLSGSGVMSTDLAVSGQYYGGTEGTSSYSWIMSSSRDGPYSLVPGANLNKLTLNADFVNLHIKAQYTPIRNDNVKGATVDSNTAIKVTIEPGTKQQVQTILSTAALNLAVLDKNKTDMNIVFSKASKNLNLKSGNKTVQKLSWGDISAVRIDPADDHHFTITCKGISTSIYTTSAKSRDNLVIILRILLALNTDSMNTAIFGTAFTNAFKKNKNISTEYANLSHVPTPDSVPKSVTSPDLILAGRTAIAFRRH